MKWQDVPLLKGDNFNFAMFILLVLLHCIIVAFYQFQDDLLDTLEYIISDVPRVIIGFKFFNIKPFAKLTQPSWFTLWLISQK